MVEINQLTLAFFRSHFPASWGQAYLADRFGQDLTDDPRFQPGQAPAGWTRLVHHLRRRGVTDQEMIAAGVATVASTGRLIDRFRDRVIFPIIHNGEILGFVGRRHPDRTDADRGGPKYLNTADTPLFHKGAQLFGAVEQHLAAGGVPVIVEGPMDAIAVTLASGGRYVGVAPLGTSLTDEQAASSPASARTRSWPPTPTSPARSPPNATSGSSPLTASTPDTPDSPTASTPPTCSPATAPQRSPPPWTRRGRSANSSSTNGSPTCHPIRPSSRQRGSSPPVPPACWDEGSSTISSRLNVPLPAVRQTLLAQVKDWNTDPRRAAATPLQGVNDVKRRLTGAAQIPPEQRWAVLADQLDQRLLRQGDWPALAQLMQKVHDQGHDVAAITRGS